MRVQCGMMIGLTRQSKERLRHLPRFQVSDTLSISHTMFGWRYVLRLTSTSSASACVIVVLKWKSTYRLRLVDLGLHFRGNILLCFLSVCHRRRGRVKVVELYRRTARVEDNVLSQVVLIAIKAVRVCARQYLGE